MILGTFKKQPVEVVDYDIDYVDWLTAGDNVASATVTVVPSGLTIGSVLINDPRVKIPILTTLRSGRSMKRRASMRSKTGQIGRAIRQAAPF